MDVQIYPFEKLTFEPLSDKTARRYVHGEKATLAQSQLKKGALIAEHQHPYEQISYVTHGSIKVTINNTAHVVNHGEVIIIPSNISHQMEALEDALVIDIYTPTRDDWIRGSDSL